MRDRTDPRVRTATCMTEAPPLSSFTRKAEAPAIRQLHRAGVNSTPPLIVFRNSFPLTSDAIGQRARMDSQIVIRLIDEVKQNPKCSDWSAKVVYVCESFWKALADENIIGKQLDSASVPAFVDLLHQEDCFALATSVIPELKVGGPAQSNSRHRRQVLDALRGARDAVAQLSAPRPIHTREHIAEQAILFETEVHRVSLMIHHSGAFTPQEERNYRAWLRSCPVELRSLRLPEVPGQRSEGNTDPSTE